MKRNLIIIVILLFIGTVFAQEDSARVYYLQGRQNFDAASIKKALQFLKEEKGADAAILRGICYWNLQLIAFSREQSGEIKKWGLKAVEELEKAEKRLGGKPQKRLKALTFRALSYQLLATRGAFSGARYGPRLAKVYKQMKAIDESHYYSRWINALNLLEAPSFAGGDPKTAQTELVRLSTDYPDSTEVKAQLANAYVKNNEPGKASKILSEILEKNPRYLLARKIQRRMK